MNIVDALIGEHAALLTLFGHIERHVPSWGLRSVKDAGLLLESMLLTHGLLEDRLLFDEVLQSEGTVSQVLESMRDEHKSFAALLEQLRAEKSETAAKSLLARLIEIAREHFAVEERVLFDLASRTLGSERAQQLGREWAVRRCLSVSG